MLSLVSQESGADLLQLAFETDFSSIGQTARLAAAVLALNVLQVFDPFVEGSIRHGSGGLISFLTGEFAPWKHAVKISSHAVDFVRDLDFAGWRWQL